MRPIKGMKYKTIWSKFRQEIEAIITAWKKDNMKFHIFDLLAMNFIFPWFFPIAVLKHMKTRKLLIESRRSRTIKVVVTFE